LTGQKNSDMNNRDFIAFIRVLVSKLHHFAAQTD
jgi:hypothetical protein